MSDDKKDMKAKGIGAPGPTPQPGAQAKKPGPAASASPGAAGKQGPPLPKPVDGKAAARPGDPRKPKEAQREEDFPLDEEEEEDAVEPLFTDESEAEEEPALEASLGATDTSERIILVVDEDGQRRNETVAIITQILPNAVIETANDPEEALGMMEEGDFDTFVVNFLMPGYSSSPFVKAVANHPEHPLLIGFAADKMSDAVDPKKGLKIIPLKRLFDLDTSTATETPEGEAGPAAAPEE